MPPLSSLGNSIPLAATHLLPAVTGTLCTGAVRFTFGKSSSEGKRTSYVAERAGTGPNLDPLTKPGLG